MYCPTHEIKKNYQTLNNQEGVDAFVALYPGCSFIARDEHLRNSLYDTLTLLAGIAIAAYIQVSSDNHILTISDLESTEAIAGCEVSSDPMNKQT